MSVTYTDGETPTVLVVEDDRDLADTYSLWLDAAYDVRTAYSGRDGLVWYDEGVDVVLLDRRMPDLRGTRVLQTMNERELTAQKALLTSVDPGDDLVDLPCDDYLTKPVTKAQLRDTVRELHMRSKLDEELQRHFTLTSKIAALQNSAASESDEALEDLRHEAERVRARVEERLAELDEFEQAFRTLE